MSSLSSTSKSLSDLDWIPASDARFELRGLPFFQENAGQWWRFPARAKDRIPSYVWETSKSSSGARIRFRSDTTALALHLSFRTPLGGEPNLALYGQAATDLYIDGKYQGSVVPAAASSELRAFFFQGVEKREREICLYLPLFAEVSVHEIGLEAGASLGSPAPFAVNGPVVFYGTSITHGGCASRPGLSYEAIVCRALNLDFVNFGFNGCGRGEREVAEFISEVTASCYVLDFSQNNSSVESLKEAYLPFTEILRARHPVTPILCITPIYWTPELPGTSLGNVHPQMRQVIRDAVKTRLAAGDKNVYLVEGYEVLGPEQGDGLTDGLHPNTLGFYWMARALEPQLRTILGLR